MTKPTSRFIVQWEGRFISGNPKINKGAKDRNTVPCYGETPVEAGSADDAARLFATTFPDTRVVDVR